MNALPPIRIVPLATAVAAAASPRLTYRSGPLISSVELSTLFWGAAWTKAPDSDLATRINGFFDAIVASAYIDQLAEYSMAGYTIGRGKRTGSATVSAQLPASVADADVRQFISQQIAAGSVPAATANSLYMLFVEPGAVVDQGGNASCRDFCGYHDVISGATYYGVLPYPDCAGCVSNLAVFDALTTTASHELAEAITDPVPGTGWYDDANGEIGDICAWQTKSVAGYTVQLLWSNAAGKCQ